RLMRCMVVMPSSAGNSSSARMTTTEKANRRPLTRPPPTMAAMARACSSAGIVRSGPRGLVFFAQDLEAVQRLGPGLVHHVRVLGRHVQLDVQARAAGL